MKNRYKVTILGITILFIIVPLYAQKHNLTSQIIKVPFDVNKVIKSVAHHPRPHKDIVGLDNSDLREDEFLIDTNLVYLPAPSTQRFPSVAFDGTNYLVVWQDERNGPFEYDIYGARVDQSGNVLDPAGIAISTTSSWQYFPSVAFDGTNYLVVWDDGDIYGARVNQAGNILDPAGIAISTATNAQTYPSVAFDGTNCLVVWYDSRNGFPDIYGARVNQAGNVLDPAGIAISTAVNGQYEPSVAFDGTNCLVVWGDHRSGWWYDSDIYGARVDQSGNVLDPAGIAISTATNAQTCPSVAFDGTNYLVVWQDERNGQYEYDIYGARVNQAGNILDPAGITISTIADYHEVPSVSFDGTNYLVVWKDWRSGSSDIYGARVDQAGNVLDPTGIAIATGANGQHFPSITFDGTNYLVVWHDYNTSPPEYQIYGARVDQTGNVLDTTGIAISVVVYWQSYPSIAFDNTNYLIVWEDWRSGSYDIYGARVNQFGNVLDPAGIAISSAANSQLRPSITFDNTNYLIVWQDERNGSWDIYGARVDQSGNVLDPAGIAISTAAGDQYAPSVAFDNTNYLVVWTDGDIYGTRVNQAGNVLDTAGITISSAANSQLRPSVAFDNTNYLVVWQDYRSSYPDLYGARVDQSGNVLDPAGIAISAVAGCQFSPSVAFDGTNYLVVWTDNRNGSFDIFCTRVDQSGNILDTAAIVISDAIDDQMVPSVAFDSINYLIVWRDYRSGSNYDIYGAKLNTAGVAIDSFVVSLQPGDQISPALAHGTGDQLLIVYSGWTGEVGGKTYNTMRIWGKLYPFTGIEEETGFQIPTSEFDLLIYPNPVHKECNVKYILPQNSNVNISMFDIVGRLVKEIVSENQHGGVYHKAIDMTDFSQGIYFIRLVVDYEGESRSHKETKKVILLK
ncbi:T9SS type A sorting domain-containing protein [candidate division WOR-3 bacterium]|nr:T9SS type A sorting domain-containing protein [candidate division WOR-3 bacterium]